MKKFFILILTLVMAVSFVSCGKDAEIDMTALGKAIEAADLFDDEFVAISLDRIESVVGIDVSKCESAEYHLGSGNTGEEYGLFTCNSKEDAAAIKAQLEARRDSQAALYADYAPEVVPVIENAVLRQEGRYVVYIVAQDQAGAERIANEYFK